MRKPLVAGNWKMHGDMSSTTKLLDGILSGLPTSNSIDIAVFPPFPYLAKAVEILGDSPVQCGAQNMSDSDEGAFTGEVSASMLKDVGCHYVLVGHSERRTLYNEDSATVAQKFCKAQAHGLVPILCVGETLAERDANQTLAVIKAQLDAVLTQPRGIQGLSQAVVAYEPVWAIGTGKTATPEQAQEIHHSIRQYLAEQDEQIANSIQILYGGSVKPANAAGLFAMADIDGGLIGGAALKADDFLALCAAAE